MKKFTLLLLSLAMSALAVTQAAKTIYFNSDWSGVPSAYVYSGDGASAVMHLGGWPGTQMTAVSGEEGWYSVELPANIPTSDVKVIFYVSNTDRYPADNEPGIEITWLPTADAGWYVLADKAWYDSKPADRPVVTATPAGGRFTTESVSVTLTCNIAGLPIYYTIDGTDPTTNSSVYNQALNFTQTTTLKTLVVNGDVQNIQSFTYRKSEAGGGTTYPSFNNAYYKTNPEGKRGSNKTINMTHNNGVSSTALDSWTADELIAQGVANDIQQRFNGGHEWTLCDVYTLYAAYDADYLYLGCQYVNTSNLDAEHATPYSSNLPICIALDLDTNLDCTGAMVDGLTDKGPWQNGTQYLNFENGMDCMVMFSTQTAAGTPGVFLPNDEGKFSYDTQYCGTVDARAYQTGILSSITAVYGKAASNGEAFYADAENNGTWAKLPAGVSKIDDPNAFLQDEGGYKDFLPEWGSKFHTFYEVKIALSTLGISEDYIKSTGIGVMWISTHGTSATSSIPYDPTCFDNVMDPYSKETSTSAEKEDVDTFTYAMARVGGPELSPVEEYEEADMPLVYSQGRTIGVANNEGGDVAVYDLVGNMIYSAKAVYGDVAFTAPSKGTFIVVAGEKAVKVLVN